MEKSAAHVKIDHRTVFSIDRNVQDEVDFLSAVYRNDLVSVKTYLENGGNPFVHDIYATSTALHAAIKVGVRHRRCAMLALLIQAYQQYDFDLNHIVALGYHLSPVFYAAKLGVRRAMKMLFNAGVDPYGALWEYYYHGPFKPEPYPQQKFIDRYLKQSLMKLTLSVYIKNKEQVHLAHQTLLRYEISAYAVSSGCDYFLLRLLENQPNDCISAGSDIRKHFVDYSYAEMMEYLKKNNISTKGVLTFISEHTAYKLLFPREALSLVVNFILTLHQQDIYAVSANYSLSHFGFIENATPETKAHVDSLLQMNLPSKRREMPMLFDYDYAVLMLPLMTKKEKKYYRNFCAIRLAARILAAGCMNGSLLTARDVLIKIASMVGDYKIHSEKKSLRIASENFQRLPAAKYTSRLFLPAPVVEPAPVNAPTLKLK